MFALDGEDAVTVPACSTAMRHRQRASAPKTAPLPPSLPSIMMNPGGTEMLNRLAPWG